MRAEVRKKISLPLRSIARSTTLTGKIVRETMMQDPRFDPFGEPVATADSQASGSGSLWLTRTGAGLFWILVIIIVAARAVYFQPGIFNGLDRAVALAQGLFASL
ncbi:MAG: hypothetical protein ACM3OF_15005 [Gemmatimonas sp.]